MKTAIDRFHRPTVIAGTCLALGIAGTARAQAPTGTPPPEAKAAVDAPKATAAPPKIEDRFDGTTAAVSAGAMLATGNSRQMAGTMNGAFDTRFSSNAIGLSVIANYGQGAAAGQPIETTAENVQGRLRYDRYIVEQASFFLINTVRHDRFQGLKVRYNLDPGFKYIFWQEAAHSFWGEGGYDFQYDVRYLEARYVLDANKNRVVDPTGTQYVLLDKTQTDHSARLFAGFKYAFNKEVTLTTGLEYLQSFIDSTRYRLNFDAVFAASLGAGLSLGVGEGMRYDHDALPGKEQLDTMTTLSLIFSFSDVSEPPKPPMCPCPPPPPPPPESPPAPPAAPANPQPLP